MKTPAQPTRSPRLSRLPVFFRSEQVAPREAVSVSPSAAKPEPVVASWRSLGVPLDLRSYEPLTRGELSKAHDRRYVDGVLDLEEPNGFGNRSAAIASSLPFTSGCFVAAAEHVARNGGVAVAPVSGFHHAGWDFGGGFCTFNGLAVAAARLLAGGVRRVGILDCDAHHGNGTQDILERVRLFAGRVEHYTRGSPHYTGSARQAPTFLAHLPRLLEAWKTAGVEVVLYQAGADPHVDDPIGCSFLTTEQLLARDVAVFETCARLGLPIAWDLAGGYQEDPAKPWPASLEAVLEIHDNTLRACAAAFLGGTAVTNEARTTSASGTEKEARTTGEANTAGGALRTGEVRTAPGARGRKRSQGPSAGEDAPARESLDPVEPAEPTRPGLVALRIGAEGGSLTLWAREEPETDSWEFAAGVVDQTMSLLFDEEDDPPAPLVWTHSWDEAVAQLDRYPWTALHPVAVHPAFRARVAAAVRQRLESRSDSRRESSRGAWARVLAGEAR